MRVVTLFASIDFQHIIGSYFPLFLINICDHQEVMKIEIPFDKLETSTLNSVMSINQRLSKFSDECSKEAVKAADNLYRSLAASAVCGAGLGAAEAGVGLIVDVILCTAIPFR